MIEACDDINPTDESPLKPERRLQRNTVRNTFSPRASQGRLQPTRRGDEVAAIHFTLEQIK